MATFSAHILVPQAYILVLGKDPLKLGPSVALPPDTMGLRVLTPGEQSVKMRNGHETTLLPLFLGDNFGFFSELLPDAKNKAAFIWAIVSS